MLRELNDGKFRKVVIIDCVALKFARADAGRRCNLEEARVWRTAKVNNKRVLCPVLYCAPDGSYLLMPAARHLTPKEREELPLSAYPPWEYEPGDDPHESNLRSCPYEQKAADFGYLSEDRLVALDYAVH